MVISKLALALAASILPGAAQAISVTFATLPQPVVEDFESFDAATLDTATSNPSFGNYSEPLATKFGWISSIFDGQVAGQTPVVTGGPWETVSGKPGEPLALIGQGDFKNTRIFDYSKIVPGYNKRIGGLLSDNTNFNGALSMLFDQDVYALGFSVAFSGFGPPGSDGGPVELVIFDQRGEEVGRHIVDRILNGDWVVANDVPFRAVTITNEDPFGIAFDDVRLLAPAPSTAALLAAVVPGLRRRRRS